MGPATDKLVAVQDELVRLRIGPLVAGFLFLSALAHALLAALKDYGAGEIFGIPGDFALPLFREIEASRILPLYTLSHEPAVGFAADAAARYRGTLGAAAVTYGAGALNMVNAVATAYAEKSALAEICGAPGAAEGRMGLGLHHQVKRPASQLLVMSEANCAQAGPYEAARPAGEDPRSSAQPLAGHARWCRRRRERAAGHGVRRRERHDRLPCEEHAGERRERLRWSGVRARDRGA